MDSSTQTVVIFIDPSYAVGISIPELPPDANYFIFQLDPSLNGLAQIASTLAGFSAVASVHIASQGAPGGMQLGSVWIDLANLGGYAQEWAAIGAALAPGGDLLLYGSNIAQGDSGTTFVDALAALALVDVAASINPTGQPETGGDLLLEYQAGLVQTAPLALIPGFTGTDPIDPPPLLTLGEYTAVASGGTLTLTGGTLVSGGIVVQSGSVSTSAGTLTLSGTVSTDSGGTLVVSGGAVTTTSGIGTMSVGDLSLGALAVSGDAANDSITSGSGNDSLQGLAGNDWLDGGAGDDTLRGGEQADTLFGGEGNDQLYGGKGSDSLSGGMNRDSLVGGIGNDVLGGGRGKDSLDGGDGNDTLAGGLGTDTLTGGIGADHFIFRTALDGALNIDTITDFASGLDVIELSATIFTAYAGQIGNMVGTSANLLYDSGTGALSYDADGAGGNAALTFAILGVAVHPVSLSDDFLIVA